MVSVLQASIGAIVGVIGLLVYSTIYTALNTDAIDAGAVSLLNVVPALLAVVIVLAIIFIFRA